MTRDDSDLAQFARLIEALRPWLGQIIIVGGRAHELFRLRAEAEMTDEQRLNARVAEVGWSDR